MDEKEKLTTATLDDLSGISRQIYLSQSQLAVVTIGSFNFTCDTLTGVVSNIPNKEGGVHSMLGKDAMQGYTHTIGRALSCAAKLHLIYMIKSLDDDRLNKVIKRNESQLQAMQEESVNKSPNAIFREVKPPVFRGFGLMETTSRTEKQKAVFEAIKLIGTDNIATYADRNQIWSNINDHLIKPAATLKAAPRK